MTLGENIFCFFLTGGGEKAQIRSLPRVLTGQNGLRLVVNDIFYIYANA
jgi:hypothetical protein